MLASRERNAPLLDSGITGLGGLSSSVSGNLLVLYHPGIEAKIYGEATQSYRPERKGKSRDPSQQGTRTVRELSIQFKVLTIQSAACTKRLLVEAS